MDHCASVLLAFPTEEASTADNEKYNKAVKAHISNINSLFKERSAVIGDNAYKLLDLLNPAINSLSYLYLLAALLPQGTKNAEYDKEFAERVILFFRRFDPRQIRYMGVAFSDLFSATGRRNVMPPTIAVPILADALLRLDPSGSVLTSNHIFLMKLAYNSNVIGPALRVAAKRIVHYPGMINPPDPKSLILCDLRLPPSSYISQDTGFTTRLTALQVLEYDWLVGLLYCAARDWPAAQAAFARTASHPSRDLGVSKVMLEAFKKWVLVSLLAEGRITTPGGFPPYISQASARTFGIMARPYAAVAKRFESADADALRLAVEVSSQQFAEDGNEGLVAEVLESHQKWQIVRLREVYSKVSLAEINTKTKSAVTGAPVGSEEDMTQLIETMIASGMLRAAIEPPRATGGDGATTPACLAFLAEEADITEQEVAQRIAQSVERIKQLGAVYNATKERLATSREYIRHAVKDQKREKDNREGGFETQIEDEDLMSGIVSGQ
ncbi:hypothetical protein MCOR27_005426 [Pyricularia oryzae]|uniref:COP9 signalosome complex subunit 3 N-terminal helical repeats domain-containing protein n=1 Tax=Pyricularia grisea TaxID=148305 RepID=A0ABQ8N7Y4_PYRGI|nr:hypothetical protein MCOR01_007399 [Pyricularia oryzae]KAI6292728.1 hypothetical protein MCOR33_009644 [Pyricularia grisea]KAI6260604.1 hypothetical protein MCOR19_003073 [Pyricularia oryzae]KAI6278883.1 hypothetical protein MCOR27_005426 [Pyricularia oryzae]KAI6279016.1 hypothetical protein MCOR26_004392 [Pyricularia oryzae]